MKRGRPSWTTKPAPATLRAVNSAIDARHRSAREIFDRWNLDRFTRFSTFQTHFAQRRRERAARQGSGGRGLKDSSQAAGGTPALPSNPPPPGSSPVDEVIGLYVQAAKEAILAGRIGKVNLSRVLSALKGLKEVRLQAMAERRAQELHAEKMSKLRQAVDQVTEQGTRTATRDAIFDEIDKVMRGAA